MPVIFSKETKAGLFEVIAEGWNITVSLGGKTSKEDFPHKLIKPQGDVKFYMGGKNGVPAVGLTSAEAAAINDAAAAEGRRSIAVTPEQMRERLVAKYKGLVDEQTSAFELAHGREDANAYSLKASYEPKIEAALKAIAEFDREHPEVISAIKAKRAQDLRHFEASN